jgi:hypothetical protein
MLEVQRSLGRFWYRFVSPVFSRSVPPSKTDSVRKLSSTRKPQIRRFRRFDEVIADERTNLFVAKVRGIDNRNLLNPCNLRNLRLKSVFDFWV